MAPSSLVTAISNNFNSAVLNPYSFYEGDYLEATALGENLSVEFLESKELEVYIEGVKQTIIPGTWYENSPGTSYNHELFQLEAIHNGKNVTYKFDDKVITFTLQLES